MKPRAFVVVDLGFGDGGKGTITDYLVRSRGATLVVRFNGGAQAGHNVVTADGRHHTFSQFGSGTFVDGVRTHLADAVVLHPTALLVENRHLEALGITDALRRLTIAASARVTTPYHQALGRLRELARGDDRHGTCGVGVGETVRDALEHPDDVLRAADLWADIGNLRAHLAGVRERLWPAARAEAARCGPGSASAGEAERELGVFDDGDVLTRWVDYIGPLTARKGMLAEEMERVCGRDETVVLEGAQGVLLDEHWGFHPHTTWSTCTTDGALRWLDRQGLSAPVHRVGVLRTYATRHGQGPLPSAAPELDGLGDLDEPHNDALGWQGHFRRGWPDPLLWGYALRATGGVDSLAVTHLDRLDRPEANGPWQVVHGYRGVRDGALDEAGQIALPDPHDFPARERLTAALLDSEPKLRALATGNAVSEQAAFVEWIEGALGVPVSIASHGPTALDKRVLRRDVLEGTFAGSPEPTPLATRRR